MSAMKDDKKVTAENLKIWGGIIREDLLIELLEAIPVDLNIFICEFTDKYVMDNQYSIEGTDILFDKKLFLNKLEGYGKLEYLERIRIFGEAGDWEVRRNGLEFNWRYIGFGESFAGIEQFLSKYESEYNLKAEDFWGKSKISYLYEHQTELILWGKNQGKSSYYQDKVASGNLKYPLDSHKQRVRLKAKYYTHKGRPQFSWYLGLEGWE